MSDTDNTARASDSLSIREIITAFAHRVESVVVVRSVGDRSVREEVHLRAVRGVSDGGAA